MGKKAEIKDVIWEILKISINAKRFLKYSFYLHEPETKEEREYLSKSSDFQFIGHALWRNAVIELSKLFCDSKDRDKFNIFHFIKKLEKNEYFGTLNIDQTKIDDWKSKLDDNRATIDLIIRLRDKVYAHSDGIVERSKLDTPTFNQTEKLIDIVESVINEIYSTVFNSTVNMEGPLRKLNPSQIIKVLAIEKKTRMDEYVKPLLK